MADPGVMTFWMVFVVALGIFVCATGLQNGLERVTKVMMIALLVIMVVLAVNSLFMPCLLYTSPRQRDRTGRGRRSPRRLL